METDMKTEFKEMQIDGMDGYITPKNSKWLAKNLEDIWNDQKAKNFAEMDRSVKEMRKLLEDGESLSKMDRPELVAHIENFYLLYQSLAECYDHMTGGLQKNLQTDFHLQGSGQAASSTSGGSSDFSFKEGVELSLSLSSDSESESFNSSVNIDGKGLHEKIVEENDADGLLEVGENVSYEELLGKVIKYQEKLRASNLRLQLSEEMVAKLKSEVHSQIESAQTEIKKRDADLEMERGQAFKLQNYVSELETHVSESNFEIERLLKELKVGREWLKGSDEEIKRLKNELANEISESTQLQGELKLAQADVAMLNAQLDSERGHVLQLQERIATCESNLSVRDNEISELRVSLSDTQGMFNLEKGQMQSDIFSLLEKQILSDATLREREIRAKELEDNIRQCETEKMEMRGLHEIQQSGMQSEINQLKEEVAERGNHVEALNKNMDKLKLKYDVLMVEKDEIRAKVNTLMAELSSRDNHIGQMEEHLQKLQVERAELNAAFETAKKLADELKLRVKELEKEVERQRIVIINGAEEKREAIRQLCFSLEHYRTGYKELRQAFLGHKRPAVLAA